MANKGKSLTARLLEYLLNNVNIIGESYTGDCDVGMTASTTTIVSDDLKGFGDDYFNTGWVMKVLHNVNNDGNPPEGEIRVITNYVSVDGTFTTAAFSANVEENDVVLVAKTEDFVISEYTLPVSPAAGSLASFISSGNGSAALGTQLGIDVSILDAIGHDGVARLDSGIDGLLADGMLNGTGLVLPADKSLYQEMGGADANSYPIATDTKFLKSVALTGEVAYSIGDILKVSATEKLKNFIAKTGGTEIAATKAIVDAIGHDGVARLDSGIDGLLADGMLNGTGLVLPADKSLYQEMGGADANSYPIATDTKFLKSVALTGEVAYSIGDILKVSTTEKIKNFIAKTGGTEIAATKSIADALGSDGTTVTDSAVSVLGAIGANNADNAFDSNTVVANEDGSVLEREEHIQTQIAYGILQIEADAGTTSSNIIDAATLTQATDDWWKGALLLSINGQNEGQARPIVSFDAATDSVDVYPVFLNTPDAGDYFLVISSWRPSVLDQQPDTAVNVNAILASETDIFDLNVAGTTYHVNSLRLKSVDPGAETITVRLRELINDVSTIVNTFTITTDNYTTYFSLMDMFGLNHLAGDDLQVTVQASAVGPYAITGQYQHSLTKST